LATALPLAAQQQTSPPPNSQQEPQTQVPEAGGPQGDTGSIALPKKGEAPPERNTEVKNPAGMPEYSLRVDVPLVNVDVGVTTKDGQFIPGLKKENFRVLEDGVPQRISNFSQTADAPITAVLVTEFAETWYRFNYDALNASYSFVNSLQPKDWIAVIAYDMKPHMLTDFTQDKREVMGAVSRMDIPSSREINTWDALYDTIDRLEGIQGRKYIILVGTGLDTFSKIRYDQVLKKVKESRNITIFCVGTGRVLRESIGDWASVSRSLGATVQSLNFLQAENAMNTFAKMTGGQFYFPRFEADMPEIFASIGQQIRNRYVLAYHPTNNKQDGTYRKLKVELVDAAGDGRPLIVHNEKGKDIKYQVVARDGYNAKHEVD
jgi:VWFA-related protein